MDNQPDSRWRRLLLLPGALLIAGTVGATTWRLMHSRSADAHAQREHPHPNGHGGTVLPVGMHHVELLQEEGGRLRLFLLGRDERELQPVPERRLLAYLHREGALEVAPIELFAEPQPGEPPGRSSTFVGKLPVASQGVPVALSLTLPVDGRGFRVRFPLEPEPDSLPHGEPQMPSGASRDMLGALYGQPAGRYTGADIRANGPKPPAEKFQGVRPRHDTNPKPGDRLCPITRTKANPRLRWVVGGREYLFCCPPCIDEFVQQAKTRPDTIQPPDEFVRH